MSLQRSEYSSQGCQLETGYPVRCIEIGAERARMNYSIVKLASKELRDGAHREFKLRKVTSLNKGAPTDSERGVERAYYVHGALSLCLDLGSRHWMAEADL